MSDTYKIGSVTVTALGGGWYELKHSSLSEPRKVHGKEAADTQAGELDQAGEGHMEQQGTDLGVTPTITGAGGGDMNTTGNLTPPSTETDKRTPAEKVQERDAGLPDPGQGAQKPNQIGSSETADQNTQGGDAKDAEIARLKEQLEASNQRADAAAGQMSDFEKRFEDFLKSAQPLVKTVIAEGEEPSQPGVPMTIPREYSGQMDAATRKMFKAAGIEVKTIVLEENESIPPTGLFLGHNGRSYMISPGEEVDVPDFLLGILDDAVMSAPVVDSKTQKVLGYRNRSKYPYREVKTKG